MECRLIPGLYLYFFLLFFPRWRAGSNDNRAIDCQRGHVNRQRQVRIGGDSSIMGGITQQPWTPTKRRGPIAAEYSSPGPACVTLQSSIGGSTVPDSKKGRAPAFSFGSRHSSKNDSPGPGPKYNITGLSSKGKDSPPAATLHSRPKDHHVDNTPAPGDYSPEKTVDHSPKYTFGLKTQTDKPSTTPELIAPTGLSDLIHQNVQDSFISVPQPPTCTTSQVSWVRPGKGTRSRPHPSPSLADRRRPWTTACSPLAPGHYDSAKSEFTKSRSPAYSISSRYQLPSDSTQKPGPGAHYPEKSGLSRHNQPLIVTAFYFIFSRTFVCFGHRLTKAPSTYSVSVSRHGHVTDTDCVDAISISKDRKDYQDAELMEGGALACRGLDLISRAATYRSSAASLTPPIVPTLTSQVLLHKTWAPAHSFGIKHSPYIATPHLLAEDKLNKGMML
uniref:Uncharacterized protein n=1 Tax=Timema douglasi TaxID=61478 RepID=A0A7R8VB87_TIMDO|nr:unnamed protein product [Timema douglasi]